MSVQPLLGGLEFGRIRRQKQQMHMLRNPQTHARMPVCPVEDQHDLLAGSSSGRAGKGGQLRFLERDGDAGRQVKEGPPRGWMD